MANRRVYGELLGRGARAIAVIIGVLLVGTLLFHFIEGYGYIYSFYFTSMLATGEGPPATPATGTGQIAASVMSFVGIGTFAVSLIFVFGPVFRRFLKMEEGVIMRDLKKIEKKA